MGKVQKNPGLSQVFGDSHRGLNPPVDTLRGGPSIDSAMSDTENSYQFSMNFHWIFFEFVSRPAEIQFAPHRRTRPSLSDPPQLCVRAHRGITCLRLHIHFSQIFDADFVEIL